MLKLQILDDAGIPSEWNGRCSTYTVIWLRTPKTYENSQNIISYGDPVYE